jgi:hypothetical protein
MAITHPTGFPIGAGSDTLGTPPTATYDMPHAYGATGDLAILGGIWNSATHVISSIVGTKSGTWTQRVHNADATTGSTLDIWTAPVTSTSGADVLTITYGSSVTGLFGNFWGDSLTGGTGVTWSIVRTGTTNSGGGTSATPSYPSLLSATTGNAQAYWGLAGNRISGGAFAGGVTAGFTYIESTFNSGNEQVFDLSLASNTTYAPATTQAPANAYDTVAMIVEAVPGVASGNLLSFF